MRIEIITGEYPPMQGGVGAYTAILAQQLQQTGQKIYLFSSRMAQSASLPLENSLCKWNLNSLAAIRQWATAQQLDLINLQFQTAAYQMSPWIHFLPDRLKIPVVTTFHDLRFPYLFPKAGPLRNWIVMHLAHRSAGVIVTNHEDAQRLEHGELIPIGSNILGHLPPDFDPRPWRKQAGAAPDDFLIAFFGLINRSKGLDTLLHSLAALRDQNIPIRLLMIGGVAGSSDPNNAAYSIEIQQLIDSLNLKNCIHWTTYLEDEQALGAYLRASDAVVLPFRDGASFRRGSLMAAFHYGSVIVTTIPQVHIPEFLPGQNLLLVPSDDPTALTETLMKLRQTPEIYDQLRQGAQQLAEHFDWQKITTAYLAYFERTLREH